MSRTLPAPSCPAPVCTVRRAPAGTLADGRAVEVVELANGAGHRARILTYGACLQGFDTPGRDGRFADIVLGHEDVRAYEAHRNFLGATVGRYANRIGGGGFSLDGVAYRLAGEGGVCLHGGPQAVDRAVWRIADLSGGASARLRLEHTSPDGEGGFPGELALAVTYTLDAAGALTIAMTATTTRPTVISLTNHAYWNLAGADLRSGSAMGHELTIAARHYTPLGPDALPTGEIRAVAGTPFDFTAPRRIGDGLRDGGDAQIRQARGYDHNFVLDKAAPGTPEWAAMLADRQSGRTLAVWTTAPGLQLYTANHFGGDLALKGGRLCRMGDGVALEPQAFPDTPNRPEFGSARLDPGQTYAHTLVFQPGLLA